MRPFEIVIIFSFAASTGLLNPVDCAENWACEAISGCKASRRCEHDTAESYYRNAVRLHPGARDRDNLIVIRLKLNQVA